jgi:hypothetical protein
MVARPGPAVVSTDPPAYTRTTLIKVALGRIRGFYAPRGGSKEARGYSLRTCGRAEIQPEGVRTWNLVKTGIELRAGGPRCFSPSISTAKRWAD